MPSFNELRRDGLACERMDYLSAGETAPVPYVTKLLNETKGPIIAATGHMTSYADLIRPFLPFARRHKTLATDRFGRSDTRENSRRFCDVDWQHGAWASAVELYTATVLPQKELN